MKATVLKEKAIDMIEGLPEDKLRDAVDYLKYLKGDYDTFSVNEKIRHSFYEIKSIREGKIKPKTLKEFLCEL